MKLSNQEVLWCRQYARAEGVSEVEVRKAVISYFDEIIKNVRRLPFNNARRIYTYEAVNVLAPVFNLPGIGRIGPVYSAYLKWRREEARELDMDRRTIVKKRFLDERIEEATQLAMAGCRVHKDYLRDPMPRGMYSKVWIIDKNGRRRAAKQVIKKQQ